MTCFHFFFFRFLSMVLSPLPLSSPLCCSNQLFWFFPCDFISVVRGSGEGARLPSFIVPVPPAIIVVCSCCFAVPCMSAEFHALSAQCRSRGPLARRGLSLFSLSFLCVTTTRRKGGWLEEPCLFPSGFAMGCVLFRGLGRRKPNSMVMVTREAEGGGCFWVFEPFYFCWLGFAA